MRYFIVTAKCGHVGKGKYIEVDFPVIANSKKEAAQKVLRRSKVKKHLCNAISMAIEVEYEDYEIALEMYKSNDYIHAHYSSQYSLEEYEVKTLRSNKKHKIEFRSRNERINYYFKKMKIKWGLCECSYF